MTDNNEKEEQTIEHGTVIYVDGGCIQQMGFGGWGMHGYHYTTEETKKGIGHPKSIATKNGYADKKSEEPKVNVTNYVDGWGSIIKGCTNNVSEILGLMNALKYIIDNNIQTATILLDSRYVLDGATKWLEGWKENGWYNRQGNQVANQELWVDLDKLLDQIKEIGCSITWKWVKGHSGDTGNDRADRNATRGRNLGQAGVVKESLLVVDANGYWSPKVEINRLFDLKKWYFNTNLDHRPVSKDGRFIYHMGDHGKDDEMLGKATPDTSYSVLFSKEPDPVLDKVREHQDLLDKSTFNMFVIANLDNIMRPNLYRELLELQKESLLKRGLRLISLDALPITYELKTPRLAFRAANEMSYLESLLEQYLEDPEKHGLYVNDITDQFYAIDKKNKVKFNKELTNGIKSITLPITYKLGKDLGTCDLILTFGIDLPKRNTLSALTDKAPKVKVITWKDSNISFRFATIVETDSDVGIWSGVYSNLRIIKPTDKK